MKIFGKRVYCPSNDVTYQENHDLFDSGRLQLFNKEQNLHLAISDNEFPAQHAISMFEIGVLGDLAVVQAGGRVLRKTRSRISHI